MSCSALRYLLNYTIELHDLLSWLCLHLPPKVCVVEGDLPAPASLQQLCHLRVCTPIELIDLFCEVLVTLPPLPLPCVHCPHHPYSIAGHALHVENGICVDNQQGRHYEQRECCHDFEREGLGDEGPDYDKQESGVYRPLDVLQDRVLVPVLDVPQLVVVADR